MNTKFFWPVRVYYEDTDAEGVVYYANYLKFFERARTEWLRARGIELDELMERDGVMFVVADMTIKYFSPARFNDALNIGVTVPDPGRVQLMFEQEAVREGADAPLCVADVRVACVAREGLAPRRIPSWVRERLK